MVKKGGQRIRRIIPVLQFLVAAKFIFDRIKMDIHRIIQVLHVLTSLTIYLIRHKGQGCAQNNHDCVAMKGLHSLSDKVLLIAHSFRTVLQYISDSFHLICRERIDA